MHTIKTHFNDSQCGTLTHNRLATSLLSIQQQMKSNDEKQQFLFEFIKNLNFLINSKRSDEWSVSVMKYIKTFLAESCKTESHSSMFFEPLIRYLLIGLESKENHVRERSCELILQCINCLSELSDDIWTQYKETMKRKLYDKSTYIRLSAIETLWCFQDEDPEVSTHLANLLQYDLSPEVRKKALTLIVFNEKTIDAIFDRSRDVDVTVRKTFYKKMKEVDPRCISIQQREFIIGNGLRDRNQDVVNDCKDLLFGFWFTNGDPVLILSFFDIMKNTELAELIVKHTPSHSFNISEHLFHPLSIESVFFASRYISNTEKSLLDSTIPEISKIVHHIENLIDRVKGTKETIKKYKTEFILGCVLSVLKCSDYSDEVGCRKALVLLRNLLLDPETTNNLIAETVLILQHIIEEADLMGFIAQVICTIRDTFGILNEDPKTPIQALSHIRCLEIIKTYLLQIEKSSSNIHFALGILNDVIIPSINSNIAVIQLGGLECLGLICLLYKPATEQYANLFFEVFSNAQSDAKIICIKTIFDIASSFGLDILPSFHILEEYLADAKDEERCILIEGFSRLFLQGHYKNLHVLKSLVLAYFILDLEKKSKQVLAFFLPAFLAHAENKESFVSLVPDLIENISSCSLINSPSNCSFGFNPFLCTHNLQKQSSKDSRMAQLAKNFIAKF